jgi:hypothetical protein
MIRQQVRMAMLAGVLAAATSAARADHAPAAAPAPCAPAYRTVCVKEWVPETYPCTRTVYKTEYKHEAYTAYKTECVPETRTRTCVSYRMVPEVKEVVRRVCVSVPVVEERTVMQAHWTCKPVTTISRRCVDRGHWECREVPCEPSLRDRLKKKFRKKDCCEPCCEPCPPTKIVRVWVPCKVWEEVPVTCMQRVCEMKPVVCRVTTCRHEWREEKCQVTVCKCVAEPRVETYTVVCKKLVPYQATRCVAVCVPHTETVAATRMVCRTVEKQVPVTDCCETVCCSSPRKCKSRCAGLGCRSRSCCD